MVVTGCFRIRNAALLYQRQWDLLAMLLFLEVGLGLPA